MLKIGQNWGKITNFPPNAQQRFAPLGYSPPPGYQGWQYGTVRYASIFAKKYGMLVRYAFFVMVRVRYVGTVRLLCDGTGTVRWYAV